jgi:hypothetical protein
MSILILILLYISTPASAQTYKGKSFLFKRIGKDKNNISLNETFHIKNDNSFTWTTVSRGLVDCPQETGTFSGKVSNEDFDRLIKKAIAEIKEQKKLKEKRVEKLGLNPQSTIMSLTIWNKSKDYYSRIKTWSNGMQNINSMMASIMGTAKPLHALRIEAKTHKKSIKVTFKNIGKKAIDLILPEKASEAFHTDEDIQIKYAHHPKSYFLKLKKDTRIELKLVSDRMPKRIYYNNQVIRHHTKSNDLIDMSICAEVQPQ